MDTTLHLLDSFDAHGSDGMTYKVRAYEHMVRDPSLSTDGREHWEPTGRTEYRLANGARVGCHDDGALQVETTGVALRKV